jgi:PAS domain-containing protein/HPt (histidine-containing phosphotransfer) domain-containing protein
MIRLGLIASLLLGPAALGQAAQRLLPGEPLYPSLEIQVDPSRSLTLDEQIKANAFTEGSSIVGFKDVNFWVRLQIENPGSDELPMILEDQWTLTDYMDIYQIRPDGSQVHLPRGHKAASFPAQRHHRYPYAEMVLAPGIHTIYVLYRTNDIVGSRIALWHVDDFRYYQQVSQLVYAFLLGSILVMSLYNFFLYLAMRIAAYLYYTIYSLAFFLFQLCFSGLLSQLSGQYHWIDEGTITFAALAIMGIVLFTQRFLQLKSYTKLLYHGGWPAVFLAILSIALTFIDFQMSALAIISGNVCVALWIVFCALYTTYKKVPEGKIYLVAWGIFVIGDIATVMYYIGFAPASLVTQWGMVVGSVTEVLMLSFGLASFVNRVRREMNKAKEALNRELAQNLSLVEAQVQSKTRDIRLILQNIQQGIFTIQGEKLLVNEEHSAALLLMLGENSVSGCSFVRVFLQKLELDADQQSQIESALISMQAEDAISFELNAHVLPREVYLLRAQGDKRIIELNWEPMLNEDSQIERILVTLRDVTLDRELQAKSRDQSEEIMVISTIVQGDPRLFGMFLKSSRVSLHRAFELAQKGGSTGKAYPELHRILHTLKGNARTEKMQNLARLIHECEEKIQQGTMELEDLKPIERELRRYHKTFDRYFATHFTLDAVSIPRDELLTLNEFLKNQGFEKHARLVRSWLQKSLFSLTQLQSRLNAEIPRLAAELGKEPCMLHCSFENVYVNHEVFEALTDMCGHLLRNSLDHGLEAMAERIEGGKTPYGHIQVTFVNGSEPGIIWRDDGRGLNMQNILEKAKLLGLASPERDVVWDEEFCLKILTTSGFTTRHEASLISGRGVGLDAVNHRLNGIGGRLQLRFTSDIKGGKLQAFEFILWLPKQSLRAAESPASLPRAS